MKSKYKFKSENTKILKALRMSRKFKIKANWSRKVSAGFVAEDIESITLGAKVYVYNLNFRFKGGREQTISIKELNLRETEEAIKFIENKISKNEKCIVCGTQILSDFNKVMIDGLPVHNECVKRDD
jgi:hypothetical protein